MGAPVPDWRVKLLKVSLKAVDKAGEKIEEAAADTTDVAETEE